MFEQIDALLQDEPEKWIAELPEFQREPLQKLLKSGLSYDQIAQSWLSASAENTYRFSATSPAGKKDAFLDSLKAEVRAFLCGDKKYKKERDGLFGERGQGRIFVVSAIAVAIAPHLNVAAPVIAPLIAITLASIGKITINAWCSAQRDATGQPPAA